MMDRKVLHFGQHGRTSADRKDREQRKHPSEVQQFRH
jgi:hypothetical protein